MNRKKAVTSEATLKAIKNYQAKHKRIIIWFPDSEKDKIQKAVHKAGYSFKKVFEAGMKKLGIKPLKS